MSAEFQSSCSPLTKALVFFHGVEVFSDMLYKFLPRRDVIFIRPTKYRKKFN